jgi:hypothetical protein
MPARGGAEPMPASKKAVKVPSAAPAPGLGTRRRRSARARDRAARRPRPSPARRRSRPRRLWATPIVASPTASTSAARSPPAPARPGRAGRRRQPGEHDHRREGAEDAAPVADAARVEVEDDEGGDGRVAERARAQRGPGRTASRAISGWCSSSRGLGWKGSGSRRAISAPTSGDAPAKSQTRPVSGGVQQQLADQRADAEPGPDREPVEPDHPPTPLGRPRCRRSRPSPR